jgi:hypothetical protein
LWDVFSLLRTVTGVTYVDMLEALCFPQLDEIENPDLMFQQDGALTHFSNVVWDALNDKFQRDGLEEVD